MAMPKFSQEIKNIIREELRSYRTGCEGVIIKVYPGDMTADVMISKPGTEMVGEVLKRIPLPYNPGLQGMDATEGQLCFVSFRDGNPRQANVTALYPTQYKDVEAEFHQRVLPIFPRFMDKC